MKRRLTNTTFFDGYTGGGKMKDESDTTILLDYTQAGDWGEESRRLRQHLAAAQESLRIANASADEQMFQKREAEAQRDKLVEALKLIEDHHNETEEWRNIAREALKECGR